MSRYPAYTVYKDSDIEWMGKIPLRWGVVRLKAVASLNMGQSPNSSDYNDLAIGKSFLQGNAEFGAETPSAKHYCGTAAKICKLGDLLISVRAPVGALNIADQEYGIGRGLCAITPSNINQRFLWYQLQHVKQQLFAEATGSTYEAVTASQVGNVWVSIPDSAEQQAIARFLDEKTAQIDGLIAKKEALLAKLTEKRTALISQAVTKGLDPTAPMKDSRIPWLGQIPAHWDEGLVKRYFYVELGKMLNKSLTVENGAFKPYLRAANIHWRQILLEDINEMEFAPHQLPRYRLAKGDLLGANSTAIDNFLSMSDS